jgi:hypothetical protein
MQIKITKSFKFAHQGCYVEQFEAGQVVTDPSQELLDVALAEAWAESLEPVPSEDKNLGRKRREVKG